MIRIFLSISMSYYAPCIPVHHSTGTIIMSGHQTNKSHKKLMQLMKTDATDEKIAAAESEWRLISSTVPADHGNHSGAFAYRLAAVQFVHYAKETSLRAAAGPRGRETLAGLRTGRARLSRPAATRVRAVLARHVRELPAANHAIGIHHFAFFHAKCTGAGDDMLSR